MLVVSGLTYTVLFLFLSLPLNSFLYGMAPRAVLRGHLAGAWGRGLKQRRCFAGITPLFCHFNAVVFAVVRRFGGDTSAQHRRSFCANYMTKIGGKGDDLLTKTEKRLTKAEFVSRFSV